MKGGSSWRQYEKNSFSPYQNFGIFLTFHTAHVFPMQLLEPQLLRWLSYWLSERNVTWFLRAPCIFFIRSDGARSIQPKFQPVRPRKEDHLKRWTRFFETFSVGPNWSIEFWTEISGNFGWMDRAQDVPNCLCDLFSLGAYVHACLATVNFF